MQRCTKFVIVILVVIRNRETYHPHTLIHYLGVILTQQIRAELIYLRYIFSLCLGEEETTVHIL